MREVNVADYPPAVILCSRLICCLSDCCVCYSVTSGFLLYQSVVKSNLLPVGARRATSVWTWTSHTHTPEDRSSMDALWHDPRNKCKHLLSGCCCGGCFCYLPAVCWCRSFSPPARHISISWNCHHWEFPVAAWGRSQGGLGLQHNHLHILFIGNFFSPY